MLISAHSMSFANITKVSRLVAVIALLAAPVVAQKNDWLIVPGSRVGPITAATTRSDLDTLFGKENVREQNLNISEAPDVATVVFPDDKSAALAVTWDREHVASVYICFATKTGPCRWRTASGIRIGTSIRELSKLNGKSFQTGGFAEEQGRVTSWRNGALEENPSACGHLVVGLAPAAMIENRDMSKNEAEDWKQLQNGKNYSSSTLPLLELNPSVSSLTMQFSGSGCAK